MSLQAHCQPFRGRIWNYNIGIDYIDVVYPQCMRQTGRMNPMRGSIGILSDTQCEKPPVKPGDGRLFSLLYEFYFRIKKQPSEVLTDNDAATTKPLPLGVAQYP